MTYLWLLRCWLGRLALHRLLIVHAHGLHGMRIVHGLRRGQRGYHEAGHCSRNGHTAGGSRRGQLALFNLLLQHGLPYSTPGIREPILELLLVNARLLHQHGLILRRRVGMRKVLRREEPGFQGLDGSGGQLATGLALAAFRVALVVGPEVLISRIIVGHWVLVDVVLATIMNISMTIGRLCCTASGGL